ncbi:MAG: RluA family pseudouridine synthase [Rikenellaceae bacterium]|nr:RluA family pseudouridine synthase [Rikenellaceae bacterium]
MWEQKKGPVVDPELETEEQQDELFEHFGITVDKGQGIIRIDKYLTEKIEGASRSRVQAAADAGNILVNDKPVKSSYKIKPLDRISLVMPYPKRQLEILPEDIPLDIVYEDDDLLIVNKEAGMVVHPGFGNYTGTLGNALTWHLKDLPLFQEGDLRAGLVHRIDKNTSGLLVIAKNEKSHAKLARQFFDHTIQRIYVALVWGNLTEEEGTITGHIGRSVRDRLQMCVFPEGEQGKHAVTHYKVLQRLGYVNLIQCRLETGRTHQIRVHMAYIGHHLFNDERYGGDRILKGTSFSKYKQFVENCFKAMPRHGLHAKSLGFVHPTTGKEMYFESELPSDMQEVIRKWETYTASRVTGQSEEE